MVSLTTGDNKVEIVDTYTKKTVYGKLRFTKTLTGADPALLPNLTFTITGPNNYKKVVKYSELTNGEIILSDVVVGGKYTVTESGYAIWFGRSVYRGDVRDEGR